tara:strand:- start:10687 stop:12243 length:1557 start_codon:yes stop_codon:yes gene_type:complete
VARILPSLGRVFAATYKGPDHLGKPTRSSKIISDASPQYKLALAGLAASGTTNLMKKIGAEVAVRALQNTKDSQIPNFGQLAAGSKEHEVSAGDTLGKIAARNKTSVSELAKLNNISDPNMIKVGQRIRLPGNEALTPEYVRAAKELNSSQYGGRPPRAARAAFLEEAARVLNNPNIDEETRQQVTAAANQVRTGRPGGYLELAKDMIMGPSAAERRDLGALSREEVASQFSSADSMAKRAAAFRALQLARDLNPSDFAQETSLPGLLSGEQSRAESKHFEDMFPPIPKPPRRLGGGQPQKFTVKEPKELTRRLRALRRNTQHLHGIALGKPAAIIKIPESVFNLTKISDYTAEDGMVEIGIPFELLNGQIKDGDQVLSAKMFESMASSDQSGMNKPSYIALIRRGHELKKEAQKNKAILGERVQAIRDMGMIDISEPFGAATDQKIREINEQRRLLSGLLDQYSGNRYGYYDRKKNTFVTPGTFGVPDRKPSSKGKNKGKGKGGPESKGENVGPGAW